MVADNDKKAAAEVLATPVQFVPGVGPNWAEVLGRLRIRTAADVVFYFPRDYQDLTDVRAVQDLEEDKLQSVEGVVEEIDLRSTAPGRSVLGVIVRQGNAYLRAIWWNQPFMREHFTRGQRVLVSGTARYVGGRWEMAHPKVQSLDHEQTDERVKLLPVYPLTEGLHQTRLRRIVQNALQLCLNHLEEVFPESYLVEHDLWPLCRALPQIHFPDDHQSLQHARRRLVYQELLILQLALALRRRSARDLRKAPPLPTTAQIDARIRRLLPFELTEGQRRVIGEITADLAGQQPTNRLLHGDVGSGKTVVAVYAMLVAVANRHQAALMAPTEVLAAQHHATLERMLAGSRVRIALLTGNQTPREREQLLSAIEQGEVDLVVGTQAIVRSGVRFARLGLVVIDEQHKFGVRQRALLKAAGTDPHYLVMTATPIPRTLAITSFGDMEVSALRELPPGRQPVNTYLVRPDERAKWWEFFRRKLGEGRQGYVVAPLIDQAKDEEVVGAEQALEALSNGELEAFRLGLVHGRMAPPEKQAVMDAFRRQDIQVLVATSVVEVGVDVPNATLMTIENADRFGLAQLHQLRGRIARGTRPGYCGVMADPQTEAAQTRLEALVSTRDGFELAEIDFQLRGPGELLGTRQHGLPAMRIANLLTDREVLEEARRDAHALVARDAGLALPEHAPLRRMVLVRYGKVLDLGDVG